LGCQGWRQNRTEPGSRGMGDGIMAGLGAGWIGPPLPYGYLCALSICLCYVRPYLFAG